MVKNKNIVVIGGGTGTYTLLLGLKKLEKIALSVIMSMADDGGSNKVLRDEFGLLPTSGIRQAIVALSRDTSILRKLFEYRYYHGKGISGMTFGNLFMAAVSDITGSQRQAIKDTCNLLDVKGNILPVSYDSASLLATYDNGVQVLGEHYIDESTPQVSRHKIVDFKIIPQIKIDKDVQKEIKDADYIILGPGDLYTNTIANLIVKGVPKLIANSEAKLIFIMNLMTKAGETYNYKASDHLEDVLQYLPGSKFSYILLNSDTRINKILLNKYRQEGSTLVVDDLSETWNGAKVIRAALRSHLTPQKVRGDNVERSMIRHDPELLQKILSKIISGKI